MVVGFQGKLPLQSGTPALNNYTGIVARLVRYGSYQRTTRGSHYDESADQIYIYIYIYLHFSMRRLSTVTGRFEMAPSFFVIR